jgi:hypothetical protein
MKFLLAFLLLIFSFSCLSQAQTVNSSASSSVSDSTLYVVDGKVLAGEALKQIPYSTIATVDVVKKDTVVNGFLYRARIYVRLKNKEYPQK